jgi:hypothetical protein
MVGGRPTCPYQAWQLRDGLRASDCRPSVDGSGGLASPWRRGRRAIIRESGKKRVVLARHIRNRRLYDAVRCWAFSALSVSPGARAYYDQRRAAGDGHEAAPRRLASELIGQLHHCVEHHVLYDEATAWPQPANPASSQAA